jgi:hypothetical protein
VRLFVHGRSSFSPTPRGLQIARRRRDRGQVCTVLVERPKKLELHA